MAEVERSASGTYDHDARWARALAGRLQIIAMVLEMEIGGASDVRRSELRDYVRALRGWLEDNPQFRFMALVDLLDAIQELATLVSDESQVGPIASELHAALVQTYPTRAAKLGVETIRDALSAARNPRTGKRRGGDSPSGSRFWEIVHHRLAPAFLSKNATPDVNTLRKKVSAMRKKRLKVPELLRGPELLAGSIVRRLAG